MGFTNPQTWTNTVVSRDDFNTYLRDNLSALKYPPCALYELAAGSADYTTTSTSFVDVDSSNLALSITTTGDGAGGAGDVMIVATLTVYSSVSNRIYFRITEDGTALNADDGLLVSEGSGVRAVSFFFLRKDASVGPHTYKLQWKTNTGTATLLRNAGTSGRDVKGQFWVREMS